MPKLRKYPPELKERAVRLVPAARDKVGVVGGARRPTQLMVDYVDANKDEFGVEPICEGPPIAPLTY